MKKNVNKEYLEDLLLFEDEGKFYWRTCEQTGGLLESIGTERPISNVTAAKLILTNIYTPYGYDERIKAFRYLLNDVNSDYGLPAWINEYERGNQ